MDNTDTNVHIHDGEMEIQVELDNIEPAIHEFIQNVQNIVGSIPLEDRFRINHTYFTTNLEINIPISIYFGEFVNEREITLHQKMSHLPKYIRIRPDDALVQNTEECTICSDTYKNGEYKRILNCNHSFHKKCIDKWFNSNTFMTCPICRTSNEPDIATIIKDAMHRIDLTSEITVSRGGQS